MQTYDNILNRLRSKAAQRFHRSAEQLEREHQLFLEWTAWELSVLYREMGTSRDYIEKNIIRKLTTERELRPKPVHALAYTTTKKHGTVLSPEDELFTVQRMSTEPPHEIYFTPLRPTKLVNAKIRFCARENSLLDYTTGQIPSVILTTKEKQVLHKGVLWWGIELGKDFEADHLCLHIDFKQKTLYKLLPLVQWQVDGIQVQSEVGFGDWLEYPQSANNRRLDAEYLFLQHLEQTILQQYKTQFVYLSALGGQSKIPTELIEKFDEEELGEHCPKRMLWLKMLFPSGFTATDVAQTQIRLNCFPIINRKLDKSKDRSPSSSDFFEIIPLSNAENHRASLADTGDFFLGIQKLSTENSTAYRATTFEDFHSAPVGYYALQAGKVEAHDYRDLQNRLAELTHYLQNESNKLQKMSHNRLDSALSDLQSGAEKLTEELERIPPKDRRLAYYLHIKLLDNQQMIYVRFWVSQGHFAEGVLRRGEVLRGSVGEWRIVLS
ncbi:MAG: hypothetical protein AAGG68_04700 [Bacteroidota bacterium]